MATFENRATEDTDFIGVVNTGQGRALGRQKNMALRTWFPGTSW